MIRRAVAIIASLAGPLVAQSQETGSLVERSQWITLDDARIELARALGEIPGREASALAAYEKIPRARLSANDLRTRRNLAMKLGRDALALDDFAALARIGSLDRRETLWFAEVLRRRGRNEEALAVLESQLENPRANEAEVDAYVTAAISAQRSSQAEVRLSRLAGEHPANPAFALGSAALFARRADLELGQQRPVAALENFRRAVELAPQNPDYWRQAARAPHYAGRSREARELLAPLSTSRAVQLETAAWDAEQNRHPARAAAFYRALALAEPGSLPAAYGLAGNLVAAGDPLGAMDGYREILRVDPESIYAARASVELEDFFRDRVRTRYTFLDEESPGRLADISRHLFLTTFGTWIGRTVELALGPRFWIESPGGVPRPYFAAGGSIFATWHASPRWQINLDYTAKAYASRSLRPTNTGGAEVTWRPVDEFFLRASYRREDVLANRYAFAQDTQADVARISFTSPVNGWFELSGDAAGRNFNDDNRQFEANGTARFTLLQRPGRLALEMRGTYLTTESQSVTIDDGDDVIHPYWTPRGYFRGTVGLFWEQPLSRDGLGKYRPSSWRAGVATSLDTDGNPAFIVSGGLRQEILRHLELDLSGSIERSPQWNGAGASASLEWTF